MFTTFGIFFFKNFSEAAVAVTAFPDGPRFRLADGQPPGRDRLDSGELKREENR